MKRTDSSQELAQRPVGGEAADPEDHAHVHFPPPLIHGAAILLAVGATELHPLTLAGWLGIPGQVLLLVALLLAIASFREFRQARNPVPPNRPIRDLMTRGPFGFSRNPLYLTLALLHTGIALVSGNGWILLGLPPALLVVRYYVIAREEAYLERRFGPAYRDYRARVRRWL